MKSFRNLVVVLCIVAGCATARQPTRTAVRAPFPAPIVQLYGSGAQMGAAHGQRLGAEMRRLYGGYFDKYFESPLQKKLALMLAAAFEKHVTPEQLEEIRALASASGMDEREVMLGQCFLDASPMTACSTITLPASAAPDHVARYGRNLDFPGFNVAENASVLLVFHPKGSYAFASLAWPGMLGVLSGINEHGLTLCNMEVDRPQRMPVGMPYTLLYRTVLERCRTVTEAVALLEKTPRPTANNLMLMDAAGDRAVVEIMPEKIVVRRAPGNAALVSTNHHRGSDLDSHGRCSRFDYLHDASAKSFGQISVRQIEQMLAQVAQGDMTLQSMVFEPSTRVMYLAVGANAPRHPYGRIELKRVFEAR